MYKRQVKDTSGAPLLSWKRLEVLVDTLDPLRQKVVIDRVAVDSPEIHARVSRQGTINWVDFFSREAATREPSATEVKAKPAPVDWSLGEAKISGGIVRWLDESHGKPFNASVEGIDLDLKKLDGKSAIPAKFEVAWHLQAGEWAKVDAVSIKGGRLDLARREVAIEQLTARAAKLLLRRAASGGIEFVEPPALRIVKASQKDSSQPWKLTVAKYRADDVGIRFEDHAVSPAVTHTIEAMSVEADNLSTEPGQTARVSTRFRLNRTADVEVGGLSLIHI